MLLFILHIGFQCSILFEKRFCARKKKKKKGLEIPTGVPLVAQWLETRLVSMRMWFDPWPHSVDCRSGIAVALV